MKLQKFSLLLTTTTTAASVAVIAAGAFSVAQGAQINFSYTGVGIDASGIITTDATETTIIGITGQRNGVSITSLVAPGTFAGNDNTFNPTGNPAFLGFGGVSFNLASTPTPVNLFFNPDTSSYSETLSNENNPIFFVPVSATFTSVPEPSPIFGLSALIVIGMGTVLKRKI